MNKKLTKADRTMLVRLAERTPREQLVKSLPGIVEDTAQVIGIFRALTAEIVKLNAELEKKGDQNEAEKLRNALKTERQKVLELKRKLESKEEGTHEEAVEFTEKIKKLREEITQLRQQVKNQGTMKKPLIKIDDTDGKLISFGVGGALALTSFITLAHCHNRPVIEKYCDSETVDGKFTNRRGNRITEKDFSAKTYVTSVVESNNEGTTVLARFHKQQCEFDDSELPKLFWKYNPTPGSSRFVTLQSIQDGKAPIVSFVQFDSSFSPPFQTLGTSGMKGDHVVLIRNRNVIASVAVEADHQINRGFLDLTKFVKNHDSDHRVGLDSQTRDRDSIERNSIKVEEYVQTRTDEILDARARDKKLREERKARVKKQIRDEKRRKWVNTFKDLIGKD